MSQLDTTAPARTSTTTGDATRVLARSSEYLVRHWRGDFALPAASVLHGLVLGALLAAVATLLGGPLVDAAEPAVAAVGLTSLWAVIAAITLWQIVGVVRAADRHARAGRGGLVAGGTVVATLLGVLVSTGLFVRAGLPQIVEASQFALGKDPIGDVELRVSDDGMTLDLEGPIVFGVATRVREVLERHPGIAHIRLTSPGGRVVEARDLRNVIRTRQLTTVATGNCASACIVAFMGGRDRLLAPGGNLGFHRYRSPGLGEPEAEASMAIDRRELGARGVPAWFLDRAFTTPNSEMWRPSFDELHAANIFTGRLGADGRRVAPPTDRAAIERELQKASLYVALHAHEPALYAELLDAMEEGAQRGVSIDEVAARAWPQVQRVAAKYAAEASEAAIIDATAVAAATLRALQRQSAEACFRYLRATSEAADLSAIPFELRQRELAATAALIESGAAALHGAPAPGLDVTDIVDRVRDELGDDAAMLERLANANLDRAAACGGVAGLYERALALPAPRNTQLLRALLARV